MRTQLPFLEDPGILGHCGPGGGNLGRETAKYGSCIAGYCREKTSQWAYWEGQPWGPWVLVMGIAQGSGCQWCPSQRPFAGRFFVSRVCTLRIRGPPASLFTSPSLLLSFPHYFRGIFTVNFGGKTEDRSREALLSLKLLLLNSLLLPRHQSFYFPFSP